VDGASTTLMCSYDAAAGSGTIPAAARAAIPVGLSTWRLAAEPDRRPPRSPRPRQRARCRTPA
jgi:hypothetical protein